MTLTYMMPIIFQKWLESTEFECELHTHKKLELEKVEGGYLRAFLKNYFFGDQGEYLANKRGTSLSFTDAEALAELFDDVNEVIKLCLSAPNAENHTLTLVRMPEHFGQDKWVILETMATFTSTAATPQEAFDDYNAVKKIKREGAMRDYTDHDYDNSKKRRTIMLYCCALELRRIVLEAAKRQCPQCSLPKGKELGECQCSDEQVLQELYKREYPILLSDKSPAQFSFFEVGTLLGVPVKEPASTLANVLNYLDGDKFIKQVAIYGPDSVDRNDYYDDDKFWKAAMGYVFRTRK